MHSFPRPSLRLVLAAFLSAIMLAGCQSLSTPSEEINPQPADQVVLRPTSGEYNLRFHFIDDDDAPYVHTRYTAYFEDGSTCVGYTDTDGYTQTFYSDKAETINISLHTEELGMQVPLTTTDLSCR